MSKLLGIKQLCEFWQAIKSALNGKVDKEAGKGLSTNDYTTAEKNKLAGIASGAEVNVQSDWNVTDTSSDAFIKNKPTIPTKTSQLTNDSDFVSDANYVHTDNNYTTAEKTKLAGIEAGAEKNRTYTDFTGKPTGNQTPGFGDTFTLQQIKQSTTGQVSGTDRTVKIPDTEATTSAHGLMSSADKTKLNGIASGAEVNVQSNWNQSDTTADDYIKNKPSIPTKTSDLTNDSDFVSDANYVHTDNNFTNAEQTKLSGIATGAEVNQNAFSNIKIGSTTVAADSKTDTVELIAGSNITLTPNATNDSVTIAATDTNTNTWNVAYATCTTAAGTAAKGATVTGNSLWALSVGSVVGVKFTNTNTAQNPTLNVNSTGAKPIYYNTAAVTTGSLTAAGVANRIIYYMYDGTNWVFMSWSTDNNTTYSAATQSATGLMSATDKTKLDGIASGAEVNVQSDWNQTTTTADDYIKNKPSVYTKTETDNRYVNISGDTMTGNLHVNTASAYVQIRATNHNTKIGAETPSANSSVGGLQFEDSQGVANGWVRSMLLTSGTLRTEMYCCRQNASGTDLYNYVSVGIDSSGNPVVNMTSSAAWRSALSVYSKSESDSRYVAIGSGVTGSNVSASPTNNQPVRLTATSTLGTYMFCTELNGGVFLWDSDNSTTKWSIRPATAAPSVDGTAAVGTSQRYARQDHVHPKDSNLISLENFFGSINRAYGSSTNMSCTAGTGYKFIGWVGAATIGWVGSIYIENPKSSNTPVWNASTGQSGNGQIQLTALFLKTS